MLTDACLRILTNPTHVLYVSCRLMEAAVSCVSGAPIRVEGYSKVKMEVAKPTLPTPTLQWVEQMLRLLAGKKITGTVTIRFSQGGVQSVAVNQELHPRHQGPVVAPQ